MADKEPKNNSNTSKNNNDNGYSNLPIFRVAVDAAGNPFYDRGPLEANINIHHGKSGEQFEFPDDDDNRWEVAS